MGSWFLYFFELGFPAEKLWHPDLLWASYGCPELLIFLGGLVATGAAGVHEQSLLLAMSKLTIWLQCVIETLLLSICPVLGKSGSTVLRSLVIKCLLTLELRHIHQVKSEYFVLIPVNYIMMNDYEDFTYILTMISFQSVSPLSKMTAKFSALILSPAFNHVREHSWEAVMSRNRIETPFFHLQLYSLQ